jgi:ankyrin repeat protein
MNAANSNDLRIVEFLINHVKNINIKNKNGQSALSMAINNNSSKVIDFLLSKGCDIHLKDTNENTLAYYLVNTFKKNDEISFEEKLKILIKRGLLMNQKQNGGNSLIHIAARKNSIDLLKRLLPYGIDINAKNNDGYTALHIAAMRADNEDLLRYLLSQGADKKIKTEFEETAFSLALENELLQKKNIKFLE